ncbi:carboxymuconolactone decarboxylase family protein [Commensalibacter oyaizuii]|uniref:Uncharacterized protein n=1 Tax=Commensalibacter oyaizuii TaxID=3043873 RepID=A0ABT6Q258_9PROT|nr:hypothetical protein [Commensalibacter sp. TBRC 16381]MDI2091205.1 hypothetical protein [Commensalibacter sp. TBRC 16381]
MMTIKRIDYYKAAPDTMKAMMDLDKSTKTSILSASLQELIRIRASQVRMR